MRRPRGGRPTFLEFAAQGSFGHAGKSDAWLIEDEESEHSGTLVDMSIAADSRKTAREVFDRYSDVGSDDYDFSRTHVPLTLARYGKDQLVSRSQAKRVLARFENFKEVRLDFDGIDEIGQAFADELFRVFALAHPEVKVVAVGANPVVRQMIRRAELARARDEREAGGR